MALTAQFAKRLGRFQLAVDITAESGGPLALLGASGSGKSVTLRCIAGILRPDRGRIELDGTVLFDSAGHIDLPPQRRGVGMLFQQYALFPNMTVRQNIAAGARGLARGERDRRVEELLARFRLERVAGQRPGQLSGGEQQRTALARMLAASPRAILLDEPLSALDSFLRWQLEEEIREALTGFSGPAVWVSHDLGEVRRNCPRVCILEDGRSAPVRDTADLLAAPRTVGEARLTGCRTIVPARPGPAGRVEIPAWGVTLRYAGPWRSDAGWAAVRARGVRPSEQADGLPCRVLRAAEDVDAVAVALRPLGAAADAPALWMELDRARWAPLAGEERLSVAIDPADVLLCQGP